MSPVKTAKDLTELTGIWAVVGMIAYMIYSGDSGGGIDKDDLAAVASVAAAEVQKAPSGEVVDLRFDHLTDFMEEISESSKQISTKLDTSIRLSEGNSRVIESNARRLDAIEAWIARQEGRN